MPDVHRDERLSADDAADVVSTLGVRSYLGAPMWVGDHLVGWLVLHAVSAPQAWTSRQRTLATGLARDLGAALLQAQAFRQQAEAVQKLREANRVKSELISTVSHELRTPLSSIAGYLELLQDGTVGALTDRQHEVLDVVARNAGRLQDLVENLLSLSKAGAPGPAPRSRVDVHGLLSDVYRVVLPLATERSLQLELAPTEALPPVLGDARMLERVLINLVSNAVKFTPPGGRVTMAAERGPHHAVVTVADTGLGIAAAELPRVFDRFYRAPEAVSREIQGTGLGLAVARSIVEEHGGTIELSSSLGDGTRAVVTLPFSSGGPVPGTGEVASTTALPRVRRGA